MKRIIQLAALALMAAIISADSIHAKTTIEWWQFWTDPAIKPVIEQMVAEFEKEHSNIDVKLTDLTWSNGHEKIVIGFASETGPDIVELGSDWIAQFADAGHLADISGEITEDSSQSDGWSMATYKDKIWAYPWFLGTRVIFANNELMRRSGIGNPTNFAPKDLIELFQVVRRVHEMSDDIYGWGSNTPEKHRLYKKFLPFFWSHNAKLFTDDNKHCIISSLKGIDGLKVYKMFHDRFGYVGTQREIEDAFLDGKIGFIMSGDWLIKRIVREKRKIDISAYMMPGEKFLGKSFMGGEFLAINDKSDNKDEALEFIRFITSPENQLRFCKANYSANPSNKKTQQDPYFSKNPILSTFVRQLHFAEHPPVDPNWVHIEEAIENAVERVVFQDYPLAQSLRDAQVEITRIRQGK